MIRLIEEKGQEQTLVTKLMSDMKPLEVCVVVAHNDTYGYAGEVVMRTASAAGFEVMSVSKPRQGHCWSLQTWLTVRELYPGETYTLELS